MSFLFRTKWFSKTFAQPAFQISQTILECTVYFLQFLRFQSNYWASIKQFSSYVQSWHTILNLWVSVFSCGKWLFLWDTCEVHFNINLFFHKEIPSLLWRSNMREEMNCGFMLSRHGFYILVSPDIESTKFEFIKWTLHPYKEAIL